MKGQNWKNIHHQNPVTEIWLLSDPSCLIRLFDKGSVHDDYRFSETWLWAIIHTHDKTRSVFWVRAFSSVFCRRLIYWWKKAGGFLVKLLQGEERKGNVSIPRVLMVELVHVSLDKGQSLTGAEQQVALHPAFIVCSVRPVFLKSHVFDTERLAPSGVIILAALLRRISIQRWLLWVDAAVHVLQMW